MTIGYLSTVILSNQETNYGHEETGYGHEEAKYSHDRSFGSLTDMSQTLTRLMINKPQMDT